MKRRTFIKSAIATAVASSYLSADAQENRKNILVLGGTGFFGPILVEEFLKRGHRVTLFNRGITNPELFPALTRIKGDRETEDQSGLKKLVNSKIDWDIVIDTWQGSSKCVADTAHILRDRTKQYQYVSTFSVYDRWDDEGIDEKAVLNPVPEAQNSVVSEHRYAIRKTLSEMAVNDVFGPRSGLFRSHGMRGYRIGYSGNEGCWPVRIARGGDVVVPDEATVCQMTDMVSLARFMVHCGENNINGAYNVAYPAMDFRQYITNIMDVTGNKATLHWLPTEFLADHDVLPYRDMPMWRDRPYGAYRFSIEKALNNGLVNRNHKELVRDQIEGYRSRYPNDGFVFGQPGQGTISMEKEREILAAWYG